jgi:hypothetical protein
MFPTDPPPVVNRRKSAPAQAGKRVRTETVPRSSPQPTLRHITLHDLQEPSRLLLLYEQSIQAKLMGSSEAERLTFAALAQHVLRYRPTNPGGLFTSLLKHHRLETITQEDEDAARRSLREHLYHCEYLYRSPECPVGAMAAERALSQCALHFP